MRFIQELLIGYQREYQPGRDDMHVQRPTTSSTPTVFHPRYRGEITVTMVLKGSRVDIIRTRVGMPPARTTS